MNDIIYKFYSRYHSKLLESDKLNSKFHQILIFTITKKKEERGERMRHLV